jgi:hypothetical protein
MRRLHYGVFGFFLSAALLSVVLAGCGGGDKKTVSDEDEMDSGTGGKSGTVAKKAELKPVDAKGTATLQGKIVLKSGDPASVTEQMTKRIREDIAKNTDRERCMAGSEAETAQQAYRIGDNKQVGNVVVFLRPPKGYYFKIDEKQIEEAKKHPLDINQPHCAFLPHVATLFPAYYNPKNPKEPTRTGQDLIVHNNATMGHNTKGKSGDITFNTTLSPRDKKVVDNFEPNYRGPAELNCNIHGWMSAYVWVLDHPYAAVSLSDTSPHEVKKSDPAFGTYEIKNVPAGAKVRLVVWHEKAGYLNAGGNDGEEIELKDGQNTKDFEMTIKE